MTKGVIKLILQSGEQGGGKKLALRNDHTFYNEACGSGVYRSALMENTQRNKVAYIRLQLIAKQTVRVLLYKTIVRIGSTPSLLLENLKAWHTTHNRE